MKETLHIYTRVSTRIQEDDGTSLDTQKEVGNKKAKELGYKSGDFPVSEKQADEILTIPSHQYISTEQIEYTIKAIRSFYLS